MNQQHNCYQFPGLPGSVRLTDCEELLPILKTVLRHWDIQSIPESQNQNPIIEIELTPDGFRRHSQWLKKESCFRDPVDAVCDFIVDLIHAYLSDKPELLCLHCAAVEFPEGLVLFPNTYRSGKSTLSAKLASRGLRLFSDDVLPLSIADRQGMALGILPRLRIPLPETADTHFKEYIDTHAGPANKRYHYSNLADTALAPLTEKAPIKGIVVLERTDEEPPSIIEANRGDMLKNVILRNFARQNTALNILDTLYALVEESACYVLKYNTLEEAANLLIEKFATSESTRSVSNRT